MYPFGGILLASIFAGYLASVICRIRAARGFRSGVGTSLTSVFISVGAVWVITFGEELLKSSNGKVAMWSMLLLTGLPSALLGVIAAAYIVRRNRTRTIEGL